jgi:AbrB family looped-hinge helix DNA binding protein
MAVIRVTRKGQITTSKDVRDSLGIEQGDYVVVVVDGDKAILSPVHPVKISELKGKLPATRPYPGTAEIRREVGREMGNMLQ